MLRLFSRSKPWITPISHRITTVFEFHDEFTNNDGGHKQNKDKSTAKPNDKLLKPLQKFQIFQDTDSQIILDVEEERRQLDQAGEEPTLKPLYDPEISLERGLTGVFEIDDLVKVLKKDNAIDVCVCQVPKELKYVDYICCVTGRNVRHMKGMAEYVRKVFKHKRHKGDVIPKIEGVNSNDWIAMDLGNIALHIFSGKARRHYDIEQLWALGSQYDVESNKKDETLEKLEKYSIYLDDLKPRTDT